LLTLAYAAFSALAVLLACIGLFGLIGPRRPAADRLYRHPHGARLPAPSRGGHGDGRGRFGSSPSASCWVLARFVAGSIRSDHGCGVSPSDSLTIAAAVALTAIFTAIAGGVPARRASNETTMTALRQQ